MDNSTAESFAKNNAKKTKLKHIDARQEWVKVLRDKSILVPVHVPTKLNLADVFTKILTVPEFIRLRVMVQPRSWHVSHLWLSRIEFRNFLAPTSFELAIVYYQPEAELSESEIRIWKC